MWTFKDRASDELRQLDYILVRKKWTNSVHNSEAYNSFKTIGSDHRVVSSLQQATELSGVQKKKPEGNKGDENTGD